MSQVMEYDVVSGESFRRPLTTEEADALQKQSAIDDAAAAKAEADSVAVAAAIAHAKSLGFTDEMISVMYPNLGAGNE